MKMNFRLAASVLVLALLSVLPSQARNRDLMKAEYLYNVARFHDAIPFFEKIVDDENDPELFGKLGDCYRLTSRIQKAAEYYGKAVKLEGCKDDNILHFAQALMELMKYDSATKFLNDYKTRHPDDQRIDNLIAGCGSAREVLDAKPKGKTSFLNFNTNGSEFAPTIWKSFLVFCADIDVDPDRSTNKIKEFTKDRIYYVPCDKNGVTGKVLKRFTFSNVSKDDHQGPATFSADGKQLYFTTSKSEMAINGQIPNGGQTVKKPLEIWIASDLDTATSEFKTLKPFRYNNTDFSVAQPAISPDGKMMLFVSDMNGSIGGSDIFMTKMGDDSQWTKPVNCGRMINTEGEEVFPYFADSRTIFFSSDGHEGIGGLDVYMTTYDVGTNTFSKPINVGTPINSSFDDISLALFPDLRSSYFSSNRPALKGGDNVYFYNRTHAYVHLKLFDDVTNNPLNVAIISFESYGNKQYVDVDKLGEFIAPVYNDIYYKVNITKNGYAPKTFMLNATSFKENDTVLQVIKITSLNLERDSDYVEQQNKKPEPALVKNEPSARVRDSEYYKKPSYLILSVVDSATKRPVKSAIVSLESEKDDREITANERGKVLTQLIPEIKYTLNISRNGYDMREITVKTIFGHDEPDTVIEKVALVPNKHALGRHHEEKGSGATADEEPAPKASKEEVESDKVFEKDKVAGRLVTLNGYYAEYNKYEIVQEKKYILDSLVQQLKDNPSMRIRIYGHADCRGGAAYNLKLSTARAIEVGKYLVSQGVDPRRLEHKGLGITKPKVKCPVCTDCTEEQHEKNRGFEYVVIHK